MALYSETVIDDVQTALESITTGNGYNNNLLAVSRADRYHRPDSAVPFAVITRDQEQRTHSVTGIGEWLNELRIVIDVTLYQDPDSSELTDEIEATWIEDVVKALAATFHVSGKPEMSSIVSVPYSAEDEEEMDDGVRFVVSFAYGEDDTTLTYTGP